MIKVLKLIMVMLLLLISCKKEKKNAKGTVITSIESPAKDNSLQPYLFADGDQLLMSWTQKMNDSTFVLRYSEYDKNKWKKPIEIAIGDDWFVNWADFPAIARNNDNLLIHFLQKSTASTYAYDIRLLLSNTNGDTWGNDFALHNDSTNTEHGFVSMLPYKDSFFITWLDGRNTGGGDHDDGHQSSGAMNIRTAQVLSTGQIIDDSLIDGKTCDCCQTSAAITSKGPIIVYRDRSDDEVRDIYISRLVSGNWTDPSLIHNDNWKINGCPVNGPKAASLNSSLVVGWFTAADGVPKVNIAFSNDDGANFNSPIQIDNGKPIGRVDIALIDEENALISWMESTEKDAEIKLVKVGMNGKKEEPIVVSSLSASRASGFPQLEILGDRIYVAWNHVEEQSTTIKIKTFDLKHFQ